MSNIWSKVRQMPPRLLALVGLLSLIAACGGTPVVQNQTAAPAAPTAAAATSAPAPTSAPATTSAPGATVTPAGNNQPNASAGNPEPGAPGGTMTGAWVGSCCLGVDNANPMRGGDYNWLNKIYSHLVTYDVGYTQLMGDLAEKWSISDDKLTWIFNLRKRVKWHDGGDFTADDVAFSLEICLDPKTGGCLQASQLAAIKGAKDFIDGKATSIAGIEVADPVTIKITTETPNAALADTLTEAYILQKASLGQVPRDQIRKSDYWTTKPIGTGPFKFTKYEAGQFVELDRFDDYWRGRPLLDKLIRREFKDSATALLAFDRGELDFTYMTADEVERESQNSNAIVIPGPSQIDSAITLNPSKHPAFGNLKFRQAILYAINRQSIIDNLYKGTATPVSCLYSNPKYIPSDINTHEYDPEKAKALLKEANIDRASLGEIVMDAPYNDQLSLDVMTAIQQDLDAVGVTIKIQQMDVASWNKRYYDDNTSEMTFRGVANGADPNRAYASFYSMSLWPKGDNRYNYSNPELDKLLDQGVAEMDPAKRPIIYQQACKIMSEDLPWVFLWETLRYGIVSKRIGNFLFTPSRGGSYYEQAEKWFIRK
jgi:peptide/nickel transport system substrate-binding protein